MRTVARGAHTCTDTALNVLGFEKAARPHDEKHGVRLCEKLSDQRVPSRFDHLLYTYYKTYFDPTAVKSVPRVVVFRIKLYLSFCEDGTDGDGALLKKWEEGGNNKQPVFVLGGGTHGVISC